MEAEFVVELNRIHDEDARQNHRLNELENTVKQLQDIIMSIQRLTLSVESLTKEVAKQGERLEVIEQRPAQNWNTMTRTIFTTVVSAIAGGIAVWIVQGLAMNMR